MRVSKKFLAVTWKVFLIPIIMFTAFGIVGPALVSAHSYILVGAGFLWMFGSVVACVWLFAQLVNLLTGDNDE